MGIAKEVLGGNELNSENAPSTQSGIAVNADDGPGLPLEIRGYIAQSEYEALRKKKEEQNALYEHLVWAAIVGGGVEGSWMALDLTLTTVAFGAAATASTAYLVATGILFPVGLAVIAYVAYLYLAKKYVEDLDDTQRKKNACVLASQLAFGIGFWIVAFTIATNPAVLGLGAFAIGTYALIGGLTSFGIIVGNLIGKAFADGLHSSQGSESWNCKAIGKESAAFLVCGLLGGPLWQVVSGINIAGISAAAAVIVAKFLIMSFIAFAIFFLVYKGVHSLLKKIPCLKEPEVSVQGSLSKFGLLAPPSRRSEGSQSDTDLSNGDPEEKLSDHINQDLDIENSGVVP